MKQRQLLVYLNGTLTGTLWIEGGHYYFRYEASCLQKAEAIPLSVSLSLTETVFQDQVVRPFFANLLPEANIRAALARKLGLSPHNEFALLAAIGGECAGAISLLPPAQQYSQKHEYLKLSDAELVKLLHSLPNEPLGTRESQTRLSLAGVHNKLPIFIQDQQYLLPQDTSPSSHIIKLSIPNIPQALENEAFCMQLGKNYFPVCDVRLQPKPLPMLIVTRYDREHANGKIIRQHQEDLCQALSIMPENKYQAEGGPNLEQCFNVIKKYSIAPVIDMKNMIAWIVFNYFIGNADAHGKNISFMINQNGINLAPFYDLMSTTVYPELSTKMAMKIGGEYRIDWIQKRHWQRLATQTGLSEQLILTTLSDIGGKIVKDAHTLRKQFSQTIIAKIIAGIAKRAAFTETILAG